MYNICLIIYKIFFKKSVQSLVYAGWWEDPGRKIKTSDRRSVRADQISLPETQYSVLASINKH